MIEKTGKRIKDGKCSEKNEEIEGRFSLSEEKDRKGKRANEKNKIKGLRRCSSNGGSGGKS